MVVYRQTFESRASKSIFISLSYWYMFTVQELTYIYQYIE